MLRKSWYVGVAAITLAMAPAASRAADSRDARARQAVDAMERAAGTALQVRLSPVSGVAEFIAAPQGGAIKLSAAAGASATERARAFVSAYGTALGLGDAGETAVTRTRGPDAVGLEHVRLQQVVRGVPVTGTAIGIHLRGAAVTAVVAKTVPDAPTVDTTPSIAAADALLAAEGLVAGELQEPDGQFSTPRLEIFNRGLLEGGASPTRLAWFVEASTASRQEYIWIDAHSGAVLLHFNQRPTALNRQIHDANSSFFIPGTLIRSEGAGPSGDTAVDNLYDYTGHTYDYFLIEHGRDSFDGAGATMVGSVRYCGPGCPCPCANAFWTGAQSVYGADFVVDDIVAHEWSHGVTQYEAGLFYFMQSGALNESYSDVFGETVDLLNGVGKDTPDMRWGIGEDTLPGVPSFPGFRNMMNPVAYSDAGKMSDPQIVCNDGSIDSGGVHSNSGINNHAYALMVDGGTYNGFTVTGIGLTKAAKIMYRSLTQYLTPTSTLADNYNAVQQACTDLIGMAGITAGDCFEVGKALDAVEMNLPWPCLPLGCAATPSPYCNTSAAKSTLLFKHNAANPARDTLTWKWQNGTVAPVDFGSPTLGSDTYSLCLYRDGALAMTASVTSGGICGTKPCWSQTASGAYRYKLRTGNADSITTVQLTPVAGKSKILLKGKGLGLVVPSPQPLVYGTDVTAQLGRSYNRRCWSTTYPVPAKRNTVSTFKDVVP